MSEKRNSFSGLLKNKGSQEERKTKVGLDAIDTSTTLESNKSLSRLLRGSEGGAIPAPPSLVLTPPNPRPPAAGLPCYLNWGMTLSVMSRMVFITTSRGTEAVQLTSNMISSQLKFSRRK